MRKFIVSLVVGLVVCACTAIAQDKTESVYREQVYKCDDKFNSESDKPENSSTIGITKTIYELTECYKIIAYEIIDKKYTRDSEYMKKKLDDYIELSGEMTGLALRPDGCYPHCGTIVGNLSAESSFEHMKQYLDLLIDGYSGFGE